MRTPIALFSLSYQVQPKEVWHKKFAVNIHWIYTLMIDFLKMYENIPCCSIVKFSGLIFEITFRFDSPSNI